MSQSLYWEPISEPKRSGFGVQVRNIVSEKFGGDVRLEYEHMVFFEGVAMAAPENSELRRDANRIVDLIVKHGAIRLWVQ